MKKYIPNIITASRFIFAFVFIISTSLFAYHTIALIILIIGAISDWLDGYLARRWNITSEFGKNFDPLADKFLTLAAFISFAINDIVNIWPVITIAIRDIINTILRYAFFTKKQIPTSKLAKIKTIVQFVFIIIVLLLQTLWEHDIYTKITKTILNSIWIDIAMTGIAVITLWTMIEYISKIKKIQHKR